MHKVEGFKTMSETATNAAPTKEPSVTPTTGTNVAPTTGTNVAPTTGTNVAPPTADRTTDSGSAPKTLEGGCECGGVRWEIAEGTPMGPLVACHCGQCNRSTSHFLAAANVKESGLTWTNTDTLKWYASSDFAERGFCGACGSPMAWRMSDPAVRTSASIMAGSFDDKSVLKLDRHIFVGHKAPYYEITDDLAQYAESD